MYRICISSINVWVVVSSHLEQEYTLMSPGKVSEDASQPLGFNKDGSEPAPLGPYYCGAQGKRVHPGTH